MKRLFVAVLLVAFAVAGFGCKSANASVSEDDVNSKQGQMEKATEEMTGKPLSELEERN